MLICFSPVVKRWVSMIGAIMLISVFQLLLQDPNMLLPKRNVSKVGLSNMPVSLQTGKNGGAIPSPAKPAVEEGPLVFPNNASPWKPVRTGDKKQARELVIDRKQVKELPVLGKKQDDKAKERALEKKNAQDHQQQATNFRATRDFPARGGETVKTPVEIAAPIVTQKRLFPTMANYQLKSRDE